MRDRQARHPAGYKLTTARILYRLPDHPALLQTFVWQKYDTAPDYPQLRKFLDFWTANIEGRLHSVEVAQARAGRRWRHASHLLRLH